jgi:hypothetical protein
MQKFYELTKKNEKKKTNTSKLFQIRIRKKEGIWILE